MDNLEYVVIRTDEDGISIEHLTKAELLKRLEEKYYGDVSPMPFIPPNSDPTEWGISFVVIKGSVVKPAPVAVVTKYTID